MTNLRSIYRHEPGRAVSPPADGSLQQRLAATALDGRFALRLGPCIRSIGAAQCPRPAKIHPRLSACMRGIGAEGPMRGEVLPSASRPIWPADPEARRRTSRRLTLSPLRYLLPAPGRDRGSLQGDDRRLYFDGLKAPIGAALAADRTLGGRSATGSRRTRAQPVDLPVEARGQPEGRRSGHAALFGKDTLPTRDAKVARCRARFPCTCRLNRVAEIVAVSRIATPQAAITGEAITISQAHRPGMALDPDSGGLPANALST